MKAANEPIMPADIGTEQKGFQPFSDAETNKAARLIVEFCQQEDCWEPFMLSELEEFMRRRNGGVSFGKLSRDGYVVIGSFRGVATVAVTRLFVAACYVAAPAG